MATSDVIIGLGSNLGDSSLILLRAWQLLGENDAVSLGELSSPYISSPVDMASNHWFTNAVGRMSVTINPHAFLDLLMETEQHLGRLRDGGQKGYQDRTLDLDLLYFGSTIMDDPRLTLPHPFRAERLFVLAPLAAIAPDFIDPVAGQPVSLMHLDLVDKINDGQLARQEITVSTWPEDPFTG